jgi:hypothetical protein
VGGGRGREEGVFIGYVAPIRDTDTAIPIRRYGDTAFSKNKDTPIRQVYKYIPKKSEYSLEEQSTNKNGKP